MWALYYAHRAQNEAAMEIVLASPRCAEGLSTVVLRLVLGHGVQIGVETIAVMIQTLSEFDDPLFCDILRYVVSPEDLLARMVKNGNVRCVARLVADSGLGVACAEGFRVLPLAEATEFLRIAGSPKTSAACVRAAAANPVRQIFLTQDPAVGRAVLARAAPSVDVLLAGAPLAATEQWVAAFKRCGVARSARLALVVRTAAACVDHAGLRFLQARLPTFFVPETLATNVAVSHPLAKRHPLAHPDLLRAFPRAGGASMQFVDAVADLDDEDMCPDPRAFDELVGRAFARLMENTLLPATALARLDLHDRYAASAALARVERALSKKHTLAAKCVLNAAPCCRGSLILLLVPMVEAGNVCACAWLLQHMSVRPTWGAVRTLLRRCTNRDVENWIVDTLW